MKKEMESRLTFRLPRALLLALRKQAEMSDRSINSQLVAIVRRAVSRAPQKDLDAASD